MSKVYSFRLSDDNPREAQAREVIEAWAGEGYSLRHIIVSALLDQYRSTTENSELKSVIEDLRSLVQSQSYKSQLLGERYPTSLPETFLESIQQNKKSGLRE